MYMKNNTKVKRNSDFDNIADRLMMQFNVQCLSSMYEALALIRSITKKKRNEPLYTNIR